LAAEIEERFGIEADLVKGQGGVFEVALDGELIFSKKALERFPAPGEVEATLAKRLSA
jgi:selT/selW/selH-like putative selenoprotein